MLRTQGLVVFHCQEQVEGILDTLFFFTTYMMCMLIMVTAGFDRPVHIFTQPFLIDNRRYFERSWPVNMPSYLLDTETFK
jgi:hypothetical protein